MSLHNLRVATFLALAPLVMQACLFTDASNYNNAPDLSNNTTTDMGTPPADMDAPEDMGCTATPLVAEQVCQDAGIECGELEIMDECGVVYEVTCNCGHVDEQCNAEGMCICSKPKEPARTCATETETGACGQISYDSGCGIQDIQDCGNSCPGNLVCDEQLNTCEAPSATCDQAACIQADRECGSLPGCPGFECGACRSGFSCVQGTCTEDAPMCGSRDSGDVCGEVGDPNERCLSMYANCGTFQTFDCRTCPGSGCEVQTHCTEYVLTNPAKQTDGFGSQLLVGSNLLFVTAPKAGDTGKIYLYRLPFANQNAVPVDMLDGDDLGIGVDLAGSGIKLGFVNNKLIVAAPDHNIVSAVPILSTTMGPRFNRSNVVAVKIGASGDRLGASLGTLSSKNAVIIGAPGHKNSEDKETGLAYVCINAVNSWNCTTIDNPARTTNGFGDSVALMESNTMTTPVAIVGEPETAIASGQSGQINLFTLAPNSGVGWSRIATLDAPTGHINFGANLYHFNDLLYISAINEGSSANSYISEAKLNASDSKLIITEQKLIESGSSYLGEQIAGNTDVIVATGRAKSGREGAVYGYDHSSQTPLELHPWLESNTSNTALSFGTSVAVTENAIIIGAPEHEVDGDDIGGLFFLPIPETSNF
ncbi:MAG: hypothetical protein VYE40_11810 [Myxococcota bacterium]|nr:hypothetical protein [Myxococcota bacterium]MEC9441782.1 hypothetical protein [Myxococcota bacterium]